MPASNGYPVVSGDISRTHFKAQAATRGGWDWGPHRSGVISQVLFILTLDLKEM